MALHLHGQLKTVQGCLIADLPPLMPTESAGAMLADTLLATTVDHYPDSSSI